MTDWERADLTAKIERYNFSDVLEKNALQNPAANYTWFDTFAVVRKVVELILLFGMGTRIVSLLKIARIFSDLTRAHY